MSGTFKGFSDHDIEKIKNGDSAPLSTPSSNGLKAAKLTSKRVTVKKMNIPAAQEEKNGICAIPEAAKLSKTVSNDEKPDDELSRPEPNDSPPTDAINITNKDETDHSNSTDDSLVDILQCEKPINLAEFEMRQKLMEEQNRRRREMITKALADKTRQTTEEAQRLDKIKKEFQTLDTRLSLDVCILRKQIDQASLSFAEAEKHYHKAESDFLAAKINLHKEREKKEQLTEHLCAIIAHNEARKAKKLEDLMEQLNENDAGKRTVVDGVCEQTGKMLELDENGDVIKDDDD